MSFSGKLQDCTASAYSYQKAQNVVPKQLEKIGMPKLSLYDICVKYFFTSASMKKAKSWNTAENLSPRTCDFQSIERVDESLVDRLYNSKTYKVKLVKSKSKQPSVVRSSSKTSILKRDFSSQNIAPRSMSKKCLKNRNEEWSQKLIFHNGSIKVERRPASKVGNKAKVVASHWYKGSLLIQNPKYQNAYCSERYIIKSKTTKNSENTTPYEYNGKVNLIIDLTNFRLKSEIFICCRQRCFVWEVTTEVW